MDYARIYDELIADRRANPPAADEYSESHHILPRCMGGSDDASNLIRLTPEDHYFAHLLLAKKHGGKLWFAVVAMASMIAPANVLRKKSRLDSRREFGHVRRSIAAFYSTYFSGPEGPNSDKDVYSLKNFDGRTVSGNRFELEVTCGIDRRAIGSLLSGDKKSYAGWFYEPHNPLGLRKSDWISMAMSKPEVFTLYHFDGSVFTGTRNEFDKFTGQQLYWQSDVQCQIKGYYRTAEEAALHSQRVREKAQHAADARGSISGLDNPRADKALYSVTNIKTGEVVHSTRVAMRRDYGIRAADASRLISGKLGHTHGWRMSPPNAANDNTLALAA